MKKKSFCGRCIYWDKGNCDHPNNKADDWFGPKHQTINPAPKINHDNRCPWFKEAVN
jgi:hypothetical protein